MDIPWWGWTIIAVVALVAVYYAVALVFFAKVSKRVFKTHDEFFKTDHFKDDFPDFHRRGHGRHDPFA